MEGDNIRRQHLSQILLPKLFCLTNDVPTPSEVLLGNNLNDKISTIETSQNVSQFFLLQIFKKVAKIFKKPSKSKEGAQQQQPHQRLQQP